MKLLVTGATGMVGRNLLADPRAAEHEILRPGRAELDVRDRAACVAYMRAHRPDAIVHLAAVVGGIQANIDEPVRFLTDNSEMALAVIGGAREAGVRTLLNVGSSCMYPKDCDGVLSPDMLLSGALEPTNEGYALAKLLAWKLADYVAREEPSFCYRTLVPCNLYGPYDDFSPTKSHMIPAAIRKVVGAMERGEAEVEIWGDGQARREFMFAADLADFIWTFLPRAETLPSLINVGIGEDRTIDGYYAAIAEAAGYQGGFRHDLDRPSGMRRKLLDVSAQTALGWKPRTGLSEGLSATIDYFRANCQD